MNEYILYDDIPSSYSPTTKKKKNIRFRVMLIVLLTLMAIAICILSITLIFSRKSTIIHYSDNTPTAVNPINSEGISISELAEKCSPTTVYIQADGLVGGFFMQQLATGEGSGVIISSDGYIITSNSLVASGTNITVILSDGSEYPAQVVGSNTETDISILKIEADGLPSAVLSNSDKVNVGDFILAIGNPLAPQVINTVTYGSIAGVNNDISFENNISINFLQIDATINPGNTGGPIFNANGELVGIITGNISSNSELSFAIPINDAKSLITSVLDTPNTPATDDDVPMIGITGYDEPYGVIIESVAEDSPASQAGLKPNDLIIKIDGTAINTVAEINKIRRSHKRGDSMVFTIFRDKETLEVTVVLE